MFTQEFANQIANEPRSTAWHGASQQEMLAMKLPNQSARLAVIGNTDLHRALLIITTHSGPGIYMRAS
jgi:hypothetical protein